MPVSRERSSCAVHELVADLGDVFAVFDSRTQDSGNVSWGVRHGDVRWFVKSAGDPGDDRPALPYVQRVALLHNAVRLSESVTHAAHPAWYRMVECVDGPLLIGEWVDGELLRTPVSRRSQPDTPIARFQALPAEEIESALTTLFDLHLRLAAQGWIAGDFYDGCLIYDFAARRLHVIDLDHYHPGARTNPMGRMFGSSRFMAPEEFERGAIIDERTTVFNLGRAIIELHPRASASVCAVAQKACREAPADRYASIVGLVSAWREALGCRPVAG